MKIVVQSSMAVRKEEAIQQINGRINALAIANVHADGVTLRRSLHLLPKDRPADPLLAREEIRLKLLAQIEAAQTPADIAEVLSSLP